MYWTLYCPDIDQVYIAMILRERSVDNFRAQFYDSNVNC